MLRSRIGLGLALACLVFSLTACGGGDDSQTTPPLPPIEPEPSTQTCPDGSSVPAGQACPTPPTEPEASTQTCLDGSSIPAEQACPTLTEEEAGNARIAAEAVALDRAARAEPVFGSVSQGSNVQNGVTTDSVSIAYSRHGDTFYPAVTIRTDDGTTLRSNDDPTRTDIVLPSARVVPVSLPSAYFSLLSDDSLSDDSDAALKAWDKDFAERYYTPEDWRIAEEIEFEALVDSFGETEGREMFIQRYGSYPIGNDVPYDPESRPFLILPLSILAGVRALDELSSHAANNFLRHPRASRAIEFASVVDILDDSIKGPELFTIVGMLGFTDYPSATAAGDDDYVSWGSWSYATTVTPSTLGDFGWGAFADGFETPVSSIPAHGTASYSGYTSGTAIKGGTPIQDNLDDDAYWDSRTFQFLGQVSLQADFATTSVRGQVDNFQQEFDGPDERAFLNDLVIDLGNASLVSGTFTGDARATTGLAGAVGKWGGRFFGTPDTGEAPPTAGGTWGVTQGTGDDDWKMLGGFGAWKP